MSQINASLLDINAVRSRLMSRVKGQNTKPERIVRSVLHRSGYRFRLHAKDLPGRPDIVFRKRRKVIFVHGCFWHRHVGCPKTSDPKRRAEFWQAKFAANVSRDQRNIAELRNSGWTAMIVWECETADTRALQLALSDFLGPSRGSVK